MRCSYRPRETILSGLLADLFQDLPSAWHHEDDIVTRIGQRYLTVRTVELRRGLLIFAIFATTNIEIYDMK